MKKWQVYVGLDPPYWTLDPDKLEKAFTDKTKALVLNRYDLLVVKFKVRILNL